MSIELHCALETRYNRYIVVNQQLNPLQISYRPVTPVTSLSINNLACNSSAAFLEPISICTLQYGAPRFGSPRLRLTA